MAVATNPTILPNNHYYPTIGAEKILVSLGVLYFESIVKIRWNNKKNRKIIIELTVL